MIKVTKKGKLSFKLPDNELKQVWINCARAAYYTHEQALSDYEAALLGEAIGALQKCEGLTITLRLSELSLLTDQLVLQYMMGHNLILLRDYLGNWRNQQLELPAPFL